MDAARLEPKSPVPFIELFAPPLEKAAIQQERLATDFNAMFGPGYASHRSQELDFHWTSPCFAELCNSLFPETALLSRKRQEIVADFEVVYNPLCLTIMYS